MISREDIFKEASYSKVPEVISLQFSGFPIIAFMMIRFINFRGSLTSKVSVSRVCNFSFFTIMAIETQEAIFLRPISSNMRQAAQWDAQKSQNLLYFVSLIGMEVKNKDLWSYVAIYLS